MSGLTELPAAAEGHVLQMTRWSEMFPRSKGWTSVIRDLNDPPHARVYARVNAMVPGMPVGAQSCPQLARAHSASSPLS